MGRRKAPEEKGEVLSFWASLTTDSVCGRVTAHSTERQTSLRGKKCSGDLLSHPFSKFSAA